MAAVRDYLSLIKFSHSIFALPFALIAFLVASNGVLHWEKLGLVVVCMVCARAAAMAYNRYADRHLDAVNPRTAGREIPTGVVSAGGALALTVVCSLGFLAASWGLNWLCFYLAFPVLAVLLGYSHAKRFTDMAHMWLGISLGLAPVAAWVALRGTLDRSLLAPVCLGLGVTLWVMGFDILYACQDEDFDRARGLRSIPARYGRVAALRISSVVHLLSVPLFWYFGFLTGSGTAYYVGVALVAAVLFFEHRVITPMDMSRVNMAFFTMNGVVSLVMLACTILDLYV